MLIQMFEIGQENLKFELLNYPDKDSQVLDFNSSFSHCFALLPSLFLAND